MWPMVLFFPPTVHPCRKQGLPAGQLQVRVQGRPLLPAVRAHQDTRQLLQRHGRGAQLPQQAAQPVSGALRRALSLRAVRGRVHRMQWQRAVLRAVRRAHTGRAARHPNLLYDHHARPRPRHHENTQVQGTPGTCVYSYLSSSYFLNITLSGADPGI